MRLATGTCKSPGEKIVKDMKRATTALQSPTAAMKGRHLSDEEELAVPIILHHRLRG